MNKKVLSAILFSALFVGTGTFTSCIDNDEPAGIEELRGAKAALLLAKVEVEKADAAFKLAQAEVEKAKAAIKNAKAEYEAACAEEKRLQNELLATQNEQTKIQLEADIAAAKQAAELAAINHEAALLDAKTALATAKRTYELTLAKIEVAKELLPYADMVELSYLQGLVSDAQGKVDDAVEDLEDAKADYDAAAIDYKYKGEIQKKRLENIVAKKEGLLAVAKEDLAKWEGFLENDVETTDWRAEIDSLNALHTALEKEKTADLALEKARFENSDEYKALKDAVTEAKKAAKVDSVYGYKYLGSDYASTLYLDGASTVFSDGENEIPEEDAKKAEVKASMDLIAQYDDDEELTSGRLYDDMKELASYTTEVQHFLDTIAAAAEADTTLMHNSKVAVKAWEDALKAYNGTVSADELEEVKDAAIKAAQTFATAYESAADAAAKKTAAETYRKALIKYYDAAKKNGMTFNKIALPSFVATSAQDVITVWTAYDVYTLLNDATNGAENLLKVYEESTTNEDYFLTSQKEKTEEKEYTAAGATTATKVATWTEGAIATEAKDDFLDKLVKASVTAFGEANLYHKEGLDYVSEHGVSSYLHKQPSEDDVKNIAFFGKITAGEIHAQAGKLGEYGKYVIGKTVEVQEIAKNYKSVMADLKAAIAYWEATYATLNAKYVAWEAALDAAELAEEEYRIENIEAIDDKIDVIVERQGRISAMITALGKAVDVYLPEGLKGSKDYDAEKGTETFAKMLSDKIAGAQTAVEGAEDALADAQIALEKNGEDNSTYNALEAAKVAYDKAQVALDDAQAELDKALKDLEKALEIFAATTAE